MVYVDNFKARFGRMVMCHMIADNSEELLNMATRIGVAAKWVQYPGTPYEHFDICMSKAEKAVQFGAVKINMRSLARITIEKLDPYFELL